ncbi:hypothetical protein EPUL_002289 [Erysiphe pulchra]|uniref:RNase H type-1 domain-containing protein n=1 Tax=Erysiphe pulchra TaxID=225359 RepID=A0A2S4PX78_9PEZI|nr:hypothetical protein EPUL_002289 [Erysiphe pulchra]
MQKSHTKFATNFIIQTDNRKAAGIVNGKQNSTSRRETGKNRYLQREWTRRERLAHVKIGNIMAKWIPSYSGNKLNEEVDRLKNAGAQMARISQPDENPNYAAVGKSS